MKEQSNVDTQRNTVQLDDGQIERDRREITNRQDTMHGQSGRRRTKGKYTDKGGTKTDKPSERHLNDKRQ